MNSDPKIIVTDAPDPEATAFIAENLAAYNESRAGFRDFRPLAILVSDPDTGELIGGLYGRTSLGVMFIDRFFLPEHLRGNRLAQRQNANRCRVAMRPVAHRLLGCRQNMARRREVRLANAKIDDGSTLGLERQGAVEDGEGALLFDDGDIGVELQHCSATFGK